MVPSWKMDHCETTMNSVLTIFVFFLRFIAVISAAFALILGLNGFSNPFNQHPMSQLTSILLYAIGLIGIIYLASIF